MRSSEYLMSVALSLPNVDGFEFIGLTYGDKEVRCRVVRGEDGLHKIEGAPHSELRGWYPLKRGDGDGQNQVARDV